MNINDLINFEYIRIGSEAYNLPEIIVKLCNTFDKKRFIRFISECFIIDMLQKRTPLLGTPDAVRNMYMYITDYIDAYISSIDFR